MSLDHDTTAAVQDFITPVSLRRSTVLVVDRDIEATDQVSKDLEGAGVRTLRANNAMQGYWLAISKDPQAIITDLCMPHGGGVDMLEALKDNPRTRDIPVVVRTDQSYPGMTVQLQRLGVAAVITKTEDRVGEVLDLVQELLASEQSLGRS